MDVVVVEGVVVVVVDTAVVVVDEETVVLDVVDGIVVVVGDEGGLHEERAKEATSTKTMTSGALRDRERKILFGFREESIFCTFLIIV